jgi:hypothetical protein
LCELVLPLAGEPGGHDDERAPRLVAELDDLCDLLELDQVSDQRSHGDVLLDGHAVAVLAAGQGEQPLSQEQIEVDALASYLGGHVLEEPCLARAETAQEDGQLVAVRSRDADGLDQTITHFTFQPSARSTIFLIVVASPGSGTCARFLAQGPIVAQRRVMGKSRCRERGVFGTKPMNDVLARFVLPGVFVADVCVHHCTSMPKFLKCLAS